MPTKSFDDTNVTDIVASYILGPLGTITPSIANHSFSNFNISGSRSEGPGVGTCSSRFQYDKSGTVGFDDPIVGIPTGSLITEVVIRKPRSASINMSASCDGAVSGVGISLSELDTSFYDTALPPPDIAEGGTCPMVVTPVTYSFSRSGSASDQIFDFSGSPITVASLISSFGSQTFRIRVNLEAAGSGGSHSDYLLSYDAGWRIQVTYTEVPFSWFIPYETRIVNGRPIRIPAGSAVAAEENPDPDTYIDAGLVSENPSGPPTYYWFSPDWWFFYPFSPIIPDDDSGWVGSDSPPECVSCLTLTLGTITVLVADASGAYALQRNKTNDTMYVRTDPDAVTTEDAPIPSPNAKIGFIP